MSHHILNKRHMFFAAMALAAIAALSACSSTSPLPAGLSQRMDQSGAQLDRNEALSLINQYRASVGASPLTQSASLNSQAQALAQQYAQSGNRPSVPEEASHMRLSAGYVNFAETFSGWRGTADDAQTIADRSMTKIGLASAYAPNSTYGVYWVLLLAE